MKWAGILYCTEMCIFAGGTGTIQKNRNGVLYYIVRKYAATTDSASIIMNNNANLHKANLVNEYLENESITRIDWPPYSSIFSPKIFGWVASASLVPLITHKELEIALLEE